LQRSSIKPLLAVIAVVSCLTGIFFVYSRPSRNGFGFEHDFVNVISGVQCLTDRCDPYDSLTLEQEFQKMGGYTPSKHFLPEWPVYPPSTFFILLPFLGFHWPLLSTIWLLLCFGFVCAAYVTLVLKFEAYRDLLSFAPFAVLLADKSIGWAVYLGQPILIAAASATLAIVLMGSESMPVLGGILLAVSLCIKPQAAYLCGLYFVLRRRTRLPALVAYLFTLGAAIAGTLMFYFRLSSLAYLKHLSANLQLSLQPGRDADPSVLNQGSASFLNLQAFLARFSHNPQIYNNLAYAVVLTLVILLAFSCWRNQNFATRPFTIVSVLVMVELLVTYHRQYDHMMILTAVPGMFEVKKKSIATYLAILMSLCAYHFSELHGRWLHGWGPAPFGPLIEVLMALLWIHSLWGVSAARQSHANEELAANV
jgi:hypothetical protein